MIDEGFHFWDCSFVAEPEVSLHGMNAGKDRVADVVGTATLFAVLNNFTPTHFDPTRQLQHVLLHADAAAAILHHRSLQLGFCLFFLKFKTHLH